MDTNWVNNEFQATDLGDQRLNKRLSKIIERFTDSPVSPINQACDDWSETKAAYRFFRNDKVKYQEIAKGHQQATTCRADSLKTILAVQDTTYFTYTHPKTKGLCKLTKNRGKHKEEVPVLGLVMHSTLAVDCDGLPLGVCNQQIYSRPPVSEKVKKLKKISHNTAVATKEKDNYRWIKALEETVKTFSGRSENVITICDREADMYDFFLRSKELNTQLLVRACQNRKVNKKTPYSEKTGQKLWELLKGKEVKGKITVDIPKRDKFPSRKAECKVKYSEFTMNHPVNHFEKHTKNLPNIQLNAIYVYEEKKEESDDAIEWMLLTTLPVESIDQALEIIQWYCLRWRIETWHKILKSGLRVEDCRLSTSQRLIRYLAVMSIVAWRIFWITLISRVSPNASCYLFLNDIEWKILYRKFQKGKKIPKKEPTVRQCVHWIARLGGFLARKKDGEPGILYMWRGLKYFAAMVETVVEIKDIYGNN
jgi:hypothetical protein